MSRIPPAPPASDRPLRQGADGRPTREALERQNFELTALLEIARGLLSAGDPGQAVGQFLLSCVAGVGAASAAGLRWEAERGRLRLWRHYGYQDGIVQDIRPVLGPEDLVFLESAEARSGVSLKPAPDSERCRDFVRRNGEWLARLDAQAIVPLVGRGGFYGLAVWGPRLLGENYGDDELDLLATAAQLCTQALENLIYHQVHEHGGVAVSGPVDPSEAPGALEPDAGPSATQLGRLSLGELRRRFPILQEIIGQSPAFERAFREIAMVAPARCPVLVLGETGTGKELAARAIHALSPRADRPFETVDCGAIPRELIESELFGHVRGAFTGATRDRRGAFELANGGTLFLDEIGELPNGAQTRLLRVLQEGRFRRVGDERAIQVDVRVVAATNRDLLGEVKAGRFREDLYYRLNVFCLRMPPLRDRRGDVAELVGHVLERLADDLGAPAARLPAALLRRLEEYAFPGNVRELRNLLTALVLRTQGRVPTLTDLENLLQQGESATPDAEVAPRGARTARPYPGYDEDDEVQGDGAAPASREEGGAGRGLKRDVETTGAWVLDQLRRCDFNLSQAERSLARLRRSPAGRSAAPVADRSSLTYYFQGECFKALAAAGFDMRRAARAIALVPDLEDRARSRLEGYLQFVSDITHDAASDEDARERARARLPKLPAPYLPHLDAVVDAHRRGDWSLESSPGSLEYRQEGGNMDGNATPRVRYRVTDLQSAVEFQGMGKAGGPGVIAEATEDGLPVIFRLVDELPSPEVRERLPWLAVISWRYDRTIRNGMPPEATNTQMIALEHAMDELEAAALSPAAGGRHSHRDVRGLGAAFGPGGLDPCRGLSGRHPAASGGMDVVSVEAPPLGMNVVERRLAA